MPLTAKQILAATMVPGRSQRVFCIGSFAKRVNFVAQQRRALNLVWALADTGKLKNSPRVAVIGGGLAGVTAAGALIGYGATVDVFEKGGRVLHRQRKTAHRRVHPTINAWPSEKISLSTELPFYDWSAGVCSEVAEAIAVDFEKMMKSLNFSINTGTTARALSPVGTQLIRVVSSPPVKETEAYDLVIITIGYGDEVEDPSFKSASYWENDNLEMHRDADDRLQNFLVSGCGDGGLIDSLRIVFFDFNEGQLAFDLAASLCGSPLAQQLEQAERAARALPDGNKKQNKAITDLLRSAYKAAAISIEHDAEYHEQRDLLKGALGDFKRILYIGDKSLDSPFSIKASPIHKLMIAYLAEFVGAFNYQTSEARALSQNRVCLGQYKFDMDETKVVIRHGAKPDFKNLLGDRDLASLQTRQFKLLDQCAVQAWPATYAYPAPPGWSSDLTSRTYTQKRREVARRAIEAIIPGANVADRPGSFRVDIESPPPSKAPRTLFRVPVDYVVEADSDAL
jgi:hypothetical protein